jgi:hypothetical protein
MVRSSHSVAHAKCTHQILLLFTNNFSMVAINASKLRTAMHLRAHTHTPISHLAAFLCSSESNDRKQPHCFGLHDKAQRALMTRESCKSIGDCCSYPRFVLIKLCSSLLRSLRIPPLNLGAMRTKERSVHWLDF